MKTLPGANRLINLHDYTALDASVSSFYMEAPGIERIKLLHGFYCSKKLALEYMSLQELKGDLRDLPFVEKQ